MVSKKILISRNLSSRMDDGFQVSRSELEEKEKIGEKREKEGRKEERSMHKKKGLRIGVSRILHNSFG